MWLLLAATCSVSFALMGTFAKTLTKRVNQFVIIWCMTSLSLPWLALFLASQGIPTIGPMFFRAAVISVLLNIVANTLQVKALSLSPLSLTVPFLAFTPLFMIVTGSVVLGERPDTRGLAGIAMIAAGAYTMNLDRIRGGLTLPFKAITQEKGSLFMLLVSAIWSVTAVYDKVAVLNSSPAFYSTFFCGAFALLYLPAFFIGLRKGRVGSGDAGRLLLLGALSALMAVTQMSAIELTLASYVIAIKRAGMVVSVILGYIVFKERHILTRLVGAALMATGVALLST